MGVRCGQSHWFSTDRIGLDSFCVHPFGHTGEHEDEQGRWWSVHRASDPTASHMDQPRPSPNDGPPIIDLVREDLLERDRVGRARYGTRLQPHNGRDALLDAYQEALDLAIYLRQLIEERKP